MANQLKKLATVAYTPGSPYVPGSPGYCVGGTETPLGAFGASGVTTATIDPSAFVNTADGGYLSPSTGLTYYPQYGQGGRGLPSSSESPQVCYPAVAARPAVPATTTYTAITGWNGGGRSVNPLVGDGAFRFTISGGTVATVVGLSPSDLSLLPSEPSHAFYVHQGVVDVIESGTVVATAPVAHAAGTELSISRTGSTITYRYGDWTYTSSAPSAGDQYLDAAIYASGDYVDNPALTGPLALTGTMDAALPALGAYLTDALEFSSLQASLPLLTSDLAVLSGEVATLAGTLRPLAGVLADRNYAALTGTLPLATLYSYGGYPEVALATLAGAIPLPAMWGLSLTGEVATLDVRLPALDGQAVDRAGYGELRGTLPALTGFALTFPETAPDYGLMRAGGAVLFDFVAGSRRPSAYARSALTVQDSYTLSMQVDGQVFDSLALSDSTSAYRLLTALAQSGLLLGTDSSTGSVAAQYAVNVLTNALTTYDGMDFLQFARTEQAVWAVRNDGLYRLRPGDDNGSPISVYVDFGETDFGSVKAKSVENVFLGLSTDGDVLVTLRSDDTDRAYRAIQRGPLMRVNGARGVTARRWNLTLEVVDATELELDTLEQLVAVSTRRWTR